MKSTFTVKPAIVNSSNGFNGNPMLESLRSNPSSASTTKTITSNNDDSSATILTAGLCLNDYHPVLNTSRSDVRIQNVIIQNPIVRALLVPECDLQARRRCMDLLSQVLASATPVLRTITAFDYRAKELIHDPTANTKLLVEQYNQIISLIAKTNPANILVLFWLAHHLQNLEKEISVLCPNLPLLPKPNIRPVTDAFPFPNLDNPNGSSKDSTFNFSFDRLSTANSNNGKKTKKQSKKESPHLSTKNTPHTPPLSTTNASPLEVSSALAPLPTRELYTRIHEAKGIIQDLADRVQGAVCMVFWDSWDAVYELVAEIVGYQIVMHVEKGRLFRPSGSAASYILSKKNAARIQEESSVRIMKVKQLESQKQADSIIQKNVQYSPNQAKNGSSTSPQHTQIKGPGSSARQDTLASILSPPDQAYFEPLKRYRLNMQDNPYLHQLSLNLSKENSTQEASLFKSEKEQTKHNAKDNVENSVRKGSVTHAQDEALDDDCSNMDVDMLDDRRDWSFSLSPSSSSSKSEHITSKSGNKVDTQTYKQQQVHPPLFSDADEDLSDVFSTNQKQVKSLPKTEPTDNQKESDSNGNTSSDNNVGVPLVNGDGFLDQELFMPQTLFENSNLFFEIQNFSSLPEISGINVDSLNMGIDMGINMGMASLGMDISPKHNKTKTSKHKLNNTTRDSKPLDNSRSNNNQKQRSSSLVDGLDSSSSKSVDEFDLFGTDFGKMVPVNSDNIDQSKPRSSSICVAETLLRNHNKKQNKRVVAGDSCEKNMSVDSQPLLSQKRSFSFDEPNNSKESDEKLKEESGGDKPTKKEYSHLRKRIRLLEEMEDEDNSRLAARQQRFQVQQQMQQLQNMQLQFWQQQKLQQEQRRANHGDGQRSNQSDNNANKADDEDNNTNENNGGCSGNSSSETRQPEGLCRRSGLQMEYKQSMSASDKAIWAQLHGSELQSGCAIKVPMLIDLNE